MISIGNDIVDLNAINRQRTNDNHFHSKFITPSELDLYRGGFPSSIPFESFVWLLWSVKESAYKYQQRLDPELIFSPIKIVVEHINIPPDFADTRTFLAKLEIFPRANDLYSGKFIINNQTLYFRSVINVDLVATIVSDDISFQNIYWEIERISAQDHETQSTSVRALMFGKLKSLMPQGSLSLKKTYGGCPILLVNNTNSNILVSLAHHGYFTSYCLGLIV